MKTRVVDDDSSSKNKTGNDGIVRMKFPNMKFWSSAELRDYWISYTDEVQSIPALYIAYKVLERATEEFVTKSVANNEKKA